MAISSSGPADELDDIERYLNATRAELMFARGIIFVEGDAEETLVPVFAEAMGMNLDQLGITICNVAGANFVPYVKLASSLGLPFAVITDWDPLDGTQLPLGKSRTIDIWDAVLSTTGKPAVTPSQRALWEAMSYSQFSEVWSPAGIFLNDQTFEISIVNTPGLQATLLDILAEQGFGSRRMARIAAWRSGTAIEPMQLLSMIADIGKGRMSAKLKKKLPKGVTPPSYVSAAIQFVASRV